MPKVAVVMGSHKDFSAVEPCVKQLAALGIEVEARVLSAHRTPEETAAFARLAQENGIEVLIAAAGKAAHLAGVLAAYTVLPVIGLPISASQLDGMDALLAIVQMPAGVPVATVAINGAQNAALLAAQILGVKYPEIRRKLEQGRADMHDDVLLHDAEIAAKVADIVKGE
ncbi:MAG TPA: 5-(carboxyamino)imidazole ribonucleotide mutase [Candidatus Fimadaptatus faecigallinarum]|uniref:N5-carboxyaminoimidazole ribonucleotide mutase n=1 Tax=Candidatus Fimadaptatus faecigallinarum TaxID=2840814 RepID=A0A9D1S5A8_9FIRM|nr:5-(carboxyamino)imidazole ribonucleotide mutase [Candidatus Fimadaptatus faecigallinarum]